MCLDGFGRRTLRWRRPAYSRRASDPNWSSDIAVRQPGHAAQGSDRYGTHDAPGDLTPSLRDAPGRQAQRSIVTVPVASTGTVAVSTLVAASYEYATGLPAAVTAQGTNEESSPAREAFSV